MSLVVAGTLAAYAAHRRSKRAHAVAGVPTPSMYLLGCDCEVGEQLSGPPETVGSAISIPHMAGTTGAVSATHAYASTGGFPFFWAVGAGLTVATILLAAEYGYAKARGWNHFLDRKSKGY